MTTAREHARRASRIIDNPLNPAGPTDYELRNAQVHALVALALAATDGYPCAHRVADDDGPCVVCAAARRRG